MGSIGIFLFYGGCWVRTLLYFLIVGLLWDQWSVQLDTPYMYIYMYMFRAKCMKDIREKKVFLIFVF